MDLRLKVDQGETAVDAYKPGQTSLNTNAVARQNDASFFPLVQCCTKLKVDYSQHCQNNHFLQSTFLGGPGVQLE